MFTLLEESLLTQYDLWFDINDPADWHMMKNKFIDIFEGLNMYSINTWAKSYGKEYVLSKALVALAKGQTFAPYFAAAVYKNWSIDFHGTPEEWYILKEHLADTNLEKLREDRGHFAFKCREEMAYALEMPLLQPKKA